MSKAQHTPGPWRHYPPMEQESIRKNAQSYMPAEAYRIAGNNKEGGRYVGLLVKSHPNEPDPTLADLALIAAAPELLEALQNMLGLTDASDYMALGEIEQQARAAIAKALGEPHR